MIFPGKFANHRFSSAARSVIVLFMQRATCFGIVTWLMSVTCLQAQPALVISNITGRTGPVSLAWTAADTNYAFTVQAADSLAGTIWLNVNWNSPWPTKLATWSDPRSATAATRYYRVLRVPAARRGALLQTNSLGSFSQAQLAYYAQLQGLPISPLYGVNYHRLTYETIDPVGGRTQATGLLCLPTGYPQPLRLLSYQHGTLVLKTDAPSSDPLGGEGFVATRSCCRTIWAWAVLPAFIPIATRLPRPRRRWTCSARRGRIAPAAASSLPTGCS
jgi:hypothetical protein